MHQNFIKNLGIGTKSYNILLKESKFNYFIISGKKSNHKLFLNRIKKKTYTKLGHLKLNKNRSSIDFIKITTKKIYNKKINKLFVIGGGTVMDFSKRVFFNLKKKNKNLEMWFFPSIVGTGAESSISSIINSNFQKKIISDENFLPTGIIYDEELSKNVNKTKKISDIIDSLTHCIESMTSINKNNYVNFLSVTSINFFIKKYKINKIFNDKINFNDRSLLSFNGGLAQSNSGSGICHALSHAAENLTKINHSRCVAFFLYPTLMYLEKYDKNVIKEIGKFSIIYIKKLLIRYKKISNFSSLEKIIFKKNIHKLLNLAMKDPCWRLYKKNININFLIKCLNEKY